MVRILDLEKEGYPLLPDYKSELSSRIDEAKDRIMQAVQDAFHIEIETIGWFDVKFISDVIDSFVAEFESSIDSWRREYASSDKEHKELSVRQRTQDFSIMNQNRMGAIGQKMQNMREGGRDTDFYTYKYLASRGFLPNYGFGGASMFLSLSDEENDIARDRVIAIL